MPVFTALEVQPFSGFYPSCQQCLRRLSVTEKPGKGYTIGTQTLARLIKGHEVAVGSYERFSPCVVNISTVGDAV